MSSTRRGEYAAAAEHLDRANALQLADWRKHGQEYDPKQYEFLVDRMIAACTPGFFERVRGFGLQSEVPVFIVGLPRSGTTLIEQILASHSKSSAGASITLAHDTMAGLGGQGVDPIEGLRQLDRHTAHRLASRHLDRLCASVPRPFASSTRCRTTTSCWVSWRASFRGRS